MTLEEINARIAQLEQNIAEKKAYQRMYRPGKATATWDYVAEGDRSGLDNIQNEETAYHNMLRQQEQQNRMLKAQQDFTAEQQNRMLKAQQDFTAEQNRLNRDNARALAAMSASNAGMSKLEAIEKELNNLTITKETLDAQGKDSRQVTARIEQIYKNYPEIQRPQFPEYDPETDVNYVLAKSGEMNYIDNAGENELEDMLATVKNYRTPEAAKERVRLEREIIKRNKASQFKEQIESDIANYWLTGNLSDLLVELGYEEAGVAGNRHLILGKKVIRNSKKGGGKPGKPVPAPSDT